MPLTQFITDLQAVATAAQGLQDALTKFEGDVSTLPQATAGEPAKAFIEAVNPQRACRLAELAVMGLEFAASFGLNIPPQVLQIAQEIETAACATPTPTPTPTPPARK